MGGYYSNLGRGAERMCQGNRTYVRRPMPGTRAERDWARGLKLQMVKQKTEAGKKPESDHIEGAPSTMNKKEHEGILESRAKKGKAKGREVLGKLNIYSRIYVESSRAPEGE